MIKKMKRKGSILIVAYSILASLLVLAVASINRSVNERNLANRNEVYIRALYLAEGAVEQGAAVLAQKIADFDDEDDLVDFGDTVVLDGNFAVRFDWEQLDNSDTITTDLLGIATFRRNYKIIGEAVHNNEPAITITVNQIIARNKTFTFQHAVFYANTLEILPGPEMTLSGRVHCNSDIYIDCNNSLTINSNYLYSAGDIFNSRLDGSGERMDGLVDVLINGGGGYADFETPPGAQTDPLDSGSPLWLDLADGAIARWGGSVRSGEHGVNTLAIPAVGSIQPGGYYSQKAEENGVKVENGTITKGGSVLQEETDMPLGTIETVTTFYNKREGKTVKMTNINLRRLAGYADDDPDGSPSFPNQLPDNGLIYATRDDAGDDSPGIRLIKGEHIGRQKGLTVVTNLPLYVQGDYNTENKKPTAVICDSVNILSNDWDDANSNGDLSGRVVEHTTEINTAFIAGVKPTAAAYSGGLENYPRFHEKWTGETLSIRGSFVELWVSSIAQGDWVYGDPQYTAPKRDWDYDLDFNDADNLPPFTPFAVQTQRIAWWQG